MFLRLTVFSVLTFIGLVAIAPAFAADAKPQEFYELRSYLIDNADDHAVVAKYIESAFLPALGRLNIDRVGVFKLRGEKEKKAEKTHPWPEHSIHVLIPFKTLKSFSDLNGQLAADTKYQAAAAELFGRAPKTPAYSRIESRLMKAFAGIPVIEQPEYSSSKAPRFFELRTYESQDTNKAALKVEMFNTGEIDIMRDVKLGPVFFGEALIGPDVPNLTYMLSGTDDDSHKAHWKGFLGHPEWDRMKKMDRYKDTVSRIRKTMLEPMSGSQL